MSTTDGAIDQKSFYGLEWIYYCLLPKPIMQMKHLPSTKFDLLLSAQINIHAINNFRGAGHICLI